MNEAKKPLVLEVDEAEKETVKAVNEIMARHSLPCSFYEPIIAEIHRQLREGKKNELSAAAEQYRTECEQVHADGKTEE